MSILFHISIFVIIFLSSHASAFSLPLVTDPGSCFSDADCPDSSYCNSLDFSGPPRCVPHLSKGMNCSTVYSRDCKPGLYCKQTDIFGASVGYKSVCTPQLPLGASCDTDKSSSCAGFPKNVCSKETYKCVRFDFGFAGNKCREDKDCQQTKGFYCKKKLDAFGFTQSDGKCTRKKVNGLECGRDQDNYQCMGYCKLLFPDKWIEKQGTCLSLKPLFASCKDSQECEGYETFRHEYINSALNRIICNRPRGATGKCMRERSLIKHLGMKCNPRMDMCDARRGLSCRSVPGDKKHVCMQRVTRADEGAEAYCTPGSKFSFCAPNYDGAPMECRMKRDDFENPPVRFAFCLRKREIVPRGGICSHSEYTVCANGLECSRVRVIKPLPTRYAYRALRYCVKVQNKIGAWCADEFWSQCAKGLQCKNGRCAKQKGNGYQNVKPSHLMLNEDCDNESLPCAPGLTCDGRCYFPKKKAQKNQVCYDTARFQRYCANGLTCKLGKVQNSLKRCQ